MANLISKASEKLSNSLTSSKDYKTLVFKFLQEYYGHSYDSMDDEIFLERLKQYTDPQEIADTFFGGINWNQPGPVTLKVYLSNVVEADTNWVKIIKRIQGPFTTFGLCHSGIQIGDIFVDWNMSSIVHIGEVKSKGAHMIFDLSYSAQKSPQFILNICTIIANWNQTKTYHRLNCNCQHFVDEILKTLQFDLPSEGALAQYLKLLRLGKSDRSFRPTNGTKTELFNSHQELEEYDLKVRSGLLGYELTTDEHVLIKSFHRGFQLREQAGAAPSITCCYGDLTKCT